MTIEGNTPQGIADGETGIGENEAEALGSLFFDDDEDDASASTPEPSEEGISEEAQADASENDDEAEQTDEHPTEEEQEEQARILAASDDMVVTLTDGTETTVHELKRGWLRESDYTQKTQALSSDQKSVSEAKQRVEQLESIMAEERAMMGRLLESRLPEPPHADLLDIDPVEYIRQKDAHDSQVAEIQQLAAQNTEARQRQHWEMQQAQQTYLANEREALVSAMPELADPAKMAEFTSSVTGALTGEYGYGKHEVGVFTDHRLGRIFSDAIAYRNLQKEIPKAVAQTQGKPPMLKSTPRKSGTSKASKEILSRIDQASNLGDAKSVSDILGDLILG